MKQGHDKGLAGVHILDSNKNTIFTLMKAGFKLEVRSRDCSNGFGKVIVKSCRLFHMSKAC